ncbi:MULTISPECIES: peptidoglycan-binding protein [unclassified Lactococcus]|uniref:peptidoglycan-binding domain-containing protein n=1 Tax=unclassified Lactococcus TaxID=2643510 RepID=UPI0011C9637C|nr:MULTISPECIES: peptidoglycan-binding domain-containing protein [unclassified Lactococcus]MQW22935.1 hypothetical protein [Lactococcus sp. dk101]TXK44518.1 peptidoglycan-binding protein [Lactococcus sp. dk310]TXK50371.1 peptidoglycan-binding protein [Lactococcus sp. dk322]
MNWSKAVAWYQENVGKHTYSQIYPRFDCSSSAAEAFAKAVGLSINALNYSTLNLASLFSQHGLTKVYSGTTAGAKNWRGYGFALMSIGQDMSSSGGNSGHVGLITPEGNFWNTTATDWDNGKIFVKNNAVQVAPWSSYTGVTRLKAHTEIWAVEETGNTPTQLEVDGYDGLLTWKAVQTSLNLIGYSLVVDGIPGKATISALQQSINAKLKVMKVNFNLVIDGIAGFNTWKGLQIVLGTPVDGVKSKPSQMIMALQKALNSGKNWI